MNKLHIACGDVYLKEFLNCDIQGDISKNKHPSPTTLHKYFQNKKLGTRHEIIIDKKLNLLHIPWEFKNNSMKEIIAISTIEHFTNKEAKKIIKEIKRILKPDGKLIIDFPDIEKDIRLYYAKNTEWCMELIYCNHKNKYSAHKWGYSFETFKKLLGEGWKSIKKKTIVKHDYPMIGIIAIKK